MDIKFTNMHFDDDPWGPVPAAKVLPDWYKNTPSFVDGKREVVNGSSPHTVKKCMPVFDAITAGYIMRTPCDVQVAQRDGLPWYEWPSTEGIQFHPIVQAALHPGANGVPFPKWMNPYSIRTPRGYSCLFIPPMHNPNGMFTVMPGLVDTDQYFSPVNFPFTLDDPSWEGLIPAGTPMVQVIPFKRDTWGMKFGGERDRADAEKNVGKLRSVWFNAYKRFYWSKKEWR